MHRRASREPVAARWLVGGALLFLAAGVAVAHLPVAMRTEPARSDAAVLRLIAEHREAEAATLARSALARARRAHGSGSMQAADAMDVLVAVAAATGSRRDVPEARTLAKESIRIRETSCGMECPELADSLIAYEALLWRLEDYRAALPLAERALAIRERAFGPRSPTVARSLYLLAEAHRAIGDYAAAEKLHRKAVSIWQADLRAYALDIANSQHYLGVLRWTMGDFAGARALIGKALALREGAAGPESEMVASEINTLGSLAVVMGDRETAMALFDRGQAIWERTLGKDDPNVARSLANKGRLLSTAGDYAGAKALFRRALSIRIGSFGPGHYLVARSLADLGRLAVAAGRYPEAERFFARALAIQQRDPQARGPELASTLIDDANLALATGHRVRAVHLALQGEAMARDHFLRTSRGLSEQDALRYETVRSTGLDVALNALAADPSRGAPDLSGPAARVWDEIIRSRGMVLDEMASRHRAVPAETSDHSGLAQVARRLSATDALVGFVKHGPPGERRSGSAPSYLALVLRPGGVSPVVVPIGGAQEIEAAIRDWQREAGTDPRLDPLHGGERRYLEAGRRLREAIWDPVAPRLKGLRRVFVVPDGAINVVNFAALPGDDGRYVIEGDPSIHYLSAERDIAVPRRPARSGGGLLALGGAEFDARPTPSDGVELTFNSTPPACRHFDALKFDSLPGSRREVDDIESLWKTPGGALGLTGPRATEGAFKRSAPGRRVLHLATHAYFLQNRCPSSLSGDLPPEGGTTVGENPLLLSGLALAGANRRTEASAGEEDGILTAEEIGALDLSGVEWAVLSGCETGLGQVLAGEGVVGLRRAFRVAGVGTLIMSLWPVDDGAARIWMHYLYDGRLHGLSTVDAVRQASLRMIASQRSSGGSTHPYFWGAFVATGDWR